MEGFKILNPFVEQIAWLANNLIWLIAGMVVCRILIVDRADNFYAYEKYSVSSLVRDIFVVYFVIVLTRMLAVALFHPILNHMNYGRSHGLQWKEVLLMGWGGVRGIIVCVMMISIEASGISNDYKFRVDSIIAGNVILCLVINGLSLPYLYDWLDPHPWDRISSANDLTVFTETEERQWWSVVVKLEQTWRFRDAEMHTVIKALPNYSFLVVNSSGGLELALQPVEVSEVMAHLYNNTALEKEVHEGDRDKGSCCARFWQCCSLCGNCCCKRAHKYSSGSRFRCSREARENVIKAVALMRRGDKAKRIIERWREKIFGKRHFISSSVHCHEQGTMIAKSANPLNMIQTINGHQRYLFKISEHRLAHCIVGVLSTKPEDAPPCHFCDEELDCSNMPGCYENSLAFLVGPDVMISCVGTLEETNPEPLYERVVFLSADENDDGTTTITIETQKKKYHATLRKKLDDLYLYVMTYVQRKCRIGALPPVAIGKQEIRNIARNYKHFTSSGHQESSFVAESSETSLKAHSTTDVKAGLSSGFIVNWQPCKDTYDGTRARYLICFHYVIAHYKHAFNNKEVNGFVRTDLVEATDAAEAWINKLLERQQFLLEFKESHPHLVPHASNTATIDRLLEMAAFSNSKFAKQTKDLKKLMHRDWVSEDLFHLDNIDPFHYEYAYVLGKIDGYCLLLSMADTLPSCTTWWFHGWAFRRYQTVIFKSHV